MSLFEIFGVVSIVTSSITAAFIFLNREKIKALIQAANNLDNIADELSSAEPDGERQAIPAYLRKLNADKLAALKAQLA